MDERRRSCCDDIVTARETISNHSKEIKSLTNLYRPVYGLCIFFVIGVAIIIGIRADAKEAITLINTNREKHITELQGHEDGDNDEFMRMNSLLSESIGRYDTIEKMLVEIREDQKVILKWQRSNK